LDLIILLLDEILDLIVVRTLFVELIVNPFEYIVCISFVTTLMIEFTLASLIHASENIWMAALLINTHHGSCVVCYAFYIKFNICICWSSFRVSLENTLLEKDMADVIAFIEWVEWVVAHYRLRENFSNNLFKMFTKFEANPYCYLKYQ
jgi:hypothetical protein